MENYFFDSSGLVKRYNNEIGTGFVLQIFRSSTQNIIHIGQISVVEVTSALTRRLNHPNTHQTYQKASRRFERDVKNRFSIFKISDSIISSAVKLAKSHKLRGYDAIQLAFSLEIEKELKLNGLTSLIFISADNELNIAAKNEGLNVKNPNNNP